MKQYNGVIDQNDLEYVKRVFRDTPVAACPAPFYRGQIHPQTSVFLMPDGSITRVFHIKPVYYQALDGSWRPMEEITTYHGNRRIDLAEGWDNKADLRFVRWLMRRAELIRGNVNIPWTTKNIALKECENVFFTSGTYYPDPNPETTTVDGRAYHSAVLTWANLIAAAGNGGDDSLGGDRKMTELDTDVAAGDWGFCIRGFYLFNTAAVPDTEEVTSATFSLYATNKGDTIGCTAAQAADHVCSSNPASNTAIVGTDYATVGSTSFGSVAYADWVTPGYRDFTLNSSGLANISKTGVSKFACRLGADILNSEPTWAASKTIYLSNDAADAAGTTQDPKLVVNSSVMSHRFFNIF